MTIVRKLQEDEGFSLLELMIVVAIILIVAAISTPNLLRARIAANEAVAAAALRAINDAAAIYSETYENGYPPSLATLGPPSGGPAPGSCDSADLIDGALVSGQKSGYRFVYTAVDPLPELAPNCSTPGSKEYTITADPIVAGATGPRHFFAAQSGGIRFNFTGPATATDPPIN